MHLGVIAPEFPPALGGVQTYTVEVATELARRCHDVTVFAPVDAAREPFPFRVVPELRLRSRDDAPRLAREHVDVWHGMNAGCAWAAQLGRPLTLSVHGNDFISAYSPFAQLDLKSRFGVRFGARPERWLDQVLARRQLRHWLPCAVHYFANSEYTRTRLEAEHRRCRGRATVAGVAVADRFLSRTDRPGTRGRHPPRLVTVARLDEPRKNVSLVLDALEPLAAEHPFEWIVVGEGDTRAALAERAARGPLANRAQFTGPVDADRLRDILESADLFVLTPAESAESFEGFGIVYLEANACGAPVLAARTGGIPEAIVEGRTGFLVDRPSADSIRLAVTRFLRGEVRFDADVCRSHARQFTWRSVVDRIEPVLLRLTGGKS